MRVLISGASIAGPVLAYWLTRAGHEVTVVERAPTLRKTGGHAVDLFRPAMDISERMGVVKSIEGKATGTSRMTLYKEGTARPSTVDLDKIFAAVSDRHVEVMRDDLGEIYYDATLDDVEYVFDDSIAALDDDGKGVDVTFERGEPRRFDLVVGADGLHSNVRRLVFGEESRYSTFIGAYLGVFSTPKALSVDCVSVNHFGVGRVAGLYSAAHMDDARAVFLFRSTEQLDCHYRDVPRQKEILRERFTGMHSLVDRWLGELDDSPAFYFDTVTQLRMNTWSRGRVTLTGDAGYCPGPALGGSTTLAVIGAYVLAGEIADAGVDHAAAFAAYEKRMAEIVRHSRAFALRAAKTLIPDSRSGLTATVGVARLFGALPSPIGRALAKLNSSGVRMYDSMPLEDYAFGSGRT